MKYLPDNFTTQHFHFVSYSLLTVQESYAVWEARNNPDVRRWMINTSPISWSDHQQFMKDLSSRSDRAYYAVFSDLEGVLKIIGTQNLNPLNKNIEGESGLFIFPEYQGKGLGRLMKREFIDYLFKNNILQQITEKVKKDNLRNSQLNKSLGFQLTGEDESFYYFTLNRTEFR